MAQDVKFERVGSVFAYKIFEAKEDKLGHHHWCLYNSRVYKSQFFFSTESKEGEGAAY